MDGQASLDSAEARLLYRLSEPDLRGRTALVLSPLELLQRLSRLIPPQRIHRHRYHGLLAPPARLPVSTRSCPSCGGEMRILAFLTDPPTATPVPSRLPTLGFASPRLRLLPSRLDSRAARRTDDFRIAMESLTA